MSILARNLVLRRRYVNVCSESSLVVASHCVLVAWTTLQVSLKGLCHIKHLDNMRHAERFIFVESEGLGGADSIFYLSAIKVTPGETRIILFGEGSDFDGFFGVLDVFAEVSDLFEECLPYALLGFASQFSVSQRDVDSGLEGWVKGLDTVSS